MIQFVIIENTNMIQSSIRRILRRFSKENEVKFKVVKYERYNEGLKKEVCNNDIRKVYFIDYNFYDMFSGIEMITSLRMNNSDFIGIGKYLYQNVFQVFSVIEKSIYLDMNLEKIIDLIYHQKYDHRTIKLICHHEEIEIYMKNIFVKSKNL